MRRRRDERYLNSADRGSARRAELADALRGVGGWLHLDEACGLSESARLVRPGEDPTVVEIGSWLGRSTISLARGLAARARPGGQVIAIDPHAGSKEHDELWPGVGTYAAFLENLERAGVRGFVQPCRMTSHEARRALDLREIDVLFVDGSHSYRDVRQDLVDWLPLLRPGAIAAFNDPVWPGVLLALLRFPLARRSAFAHPAILDNTVFLTHLGAGRVARADRRRLAAFRVELVLRFLLARLLILWQRWRAGGSSNVLGNADQSAVGRHHRTAAGQ